MDTIKNLLIKFQEYLIENSISEYDYSYSVIAKSFMEKYNIKDFNFSNMIIGELFLKNDKVLKIKNFQLKKSNLIQVNLHNDGDFSETVWVCIDDETNDKYKNGDYYSNHSHYGSLRNDPFCIQFDALGLIIPIRFNGENLPECDISIIDFDKTKEENNGTLIFNLNKIENDRSI